MKRYFLFVIGELEDIAKVCYIIDSISEITTSAFVKFNFVDKKTLVIHFETQVPFFKLKSLTDIITEKSNYNTFLINYNDNMSVNFIKPSVLESFLDLSTNNGTKDLDNFLGEKVEEYYEEIEEDTQTEVQVQTETVKQKVYNVDEILDKINKSGMKSLTQEEINYLKSIN